MAMQAIDRNTGLPSNVSLTANTAVNKSTGPVQTSGQTTASDRTSQAVSGFTSGLNTTTVALDALNSLIAQLTDRPAVSDAELADKFPVATRQFSPQFGWYWVLPNGMSTDEKGAKEFNTQQAVKRQKAVEAAGTIKGGTERQKETESNRKQEIAHNRQLQGEYSKEAAMGDAQFLVNKAIADALEAAMPQISAQLEGAGTSKSTLAGAFLQRAATKGATEGAALGANLSAQYGQLNVGLANVLEELTRSDPNSPEGMLLQAIIGSKGIATFGQNSQVADTGSDKTVTENKTVAPTTANITKNTLPFGSLLAGSTPQATTNALTTNTALYDTDVSTLYGDEA